MKRTNRSFRFVVALLLVFSLAFPMTFNAYALTSVDGEAAPTLSNVSEQVQDDPVDTGSEASPLKLTADDDLEIVSVQVVNGGEEQDRNRDYVSIYSVKKDTELFSISAETSPIYEVDPDTVYYTDLRSASMTDARIFKVKAEVTYDELGISEFSKFKQDKINWIYGSKYLSDWKIYNSKTGKFDSATPAISVVTQSAIESGDETVTITAEILFDEFYPEFDYYTTNLPYAGFTPVKKEGFPVFVGDSTILGPHDLVVNYGSRQLTGTEIPLNLYDSFHTWYQIDKYARDLQRECENNKNYINDKYVEVSSIAKSQLKNRDVWNIVIAEDSDSVEAYLNDGGTKDQMQNNPMELLADLDNEESNHKIPIYFNNVHPDETPASDAIMQLIDSFLYDEDGNLSYFTYAEPDTKHVDKNATSAGFTIETDVNKRVEKSINIEDVLDKFILVFNITENPDGRDNMVRTNEYGFDLNRDAAYQTQKESTALTSDLVKWDPMAMLEYHGYVDELLIEPCTGPHDPNYEYDLYEEMMLAQGKTLGRAMIGNTAYEQFLVPATDYYDGWDDGAPVYGPMFAMLFGVMGYTLEIPYSTEDSVEACYTAGLALVDDCYENFDTYYENKLTYKQRGIDNADEKELVDHHFKNPYTGDIVGRPRNELGKFFPEYYVIPVTEIQKNPLEAYKALAFLQRNGVKIEKTTVDDIEYGDLKLPVGTYFIDMNQSSRGLINSMLSEGYDASDFKDIYAELVISYPDMRNFDCITIWNDDFEDQLIERREPAEKIEIPSTRIGIPQEMMTEADADPGLVAIRNDNIDAIRLVNRLLDDDKTVQMLTADFGTYKKGDFVVSAEDLYSYSKGLLVFGSIFEETQPDTKSVSLPSLETIVEPNISILGSQTHSKFVLDLLGFNNDYTYVSKPESITAENTDVIVGFNSDANVAAKIKDDGIGYIGIGYRPLNFVKNNNLLPGFDFDMPGASYNEGLVAASYASDNLITANYDDTNAAYLMNGTFITKAPYNGESLIKINDSEDFFKAGWYPNHDVLKNQSLAVTGYTGTDLDVPVTLFSNNIFSKAHGQYIFNMFANAVFLTASDIDVKPLVKASPASAQGRSTDVTLTYIADRDGNTDVTIVDAKYKVTKSASEPAYTGDDSWKSYVSGSSIKLDSTGAWYIHAYAKNSNNADIQLVFGPYDITSGDGGGGGGGGGSHSNTPAATKPATTPTPAAFSDISGHWARNSIEYVVGKKLFSGITDRMFGPDETMTRGMLVTVLGRAYGLDTAPYSAKSVFTDVPSTAYYAPYVAWAYEKKIVSGLGDGLFAPDKPVTRGEMAAIITNYMKFIGKGNSSTADLTYADIANIDSWGLEGVKFVTANGLMTGTSGNNFDFDGLSTRAQVATVMERLMKLIGQ